MTTHDLKLLDTLRLKYLDINYFFPKIHRRVIEGYTDLRSRKRDAVEEK